MVLSYLARGASMISYQKATISATLLIVMSAIAGLSAQEEIRLGGRRIVGGEPAEIKDYPWQIAINIRRTDGTYLCGGSYIYDKWVLSAAHCFHASDAVDSIKIKGGATNYVDQGTWAQVDSFVIHQKYDPKTSEHDVALVRLKAAPPSRVIPLANDPPIIQAGQPLEVTGWGVTTESGRISKTLLKATVPYVDNQTCNEPTSYNGRVLPGMMCAGRLDGGADSCQGDSGGPLVWRTDNGPFLVGVVSFGDGCARALKYGVYTRVSMYRDWIHTVTGGN
jgi:trypsin